MDTFAKHIKETSNENLELNKQINKVQYALGDFGCGTKVLKTEKNEEFGGRSSKMIGMVQQGGKHFGGKNSKMVGSMQQGGSKYGWKNGRVIFLMRQCNYLNWFLATRYLAVFVVFFATIDWICVKIYPNYSFYL